VILLLLLAVLMRSVNAYIPPVGPGHCVDPRGCDLPGGDSGGTVTYYDPDIPPLPQQPWVYGPNDPGEYMMNCLNSINLMGDIGKNIRYCESVMQNKFTYIVNMINRCRNICYAKSINCDNFCSNDYALYAWWKREAVDGYVIDNTVNAWEYQLAQAGRLFCWNNGKPSFTCKSLLCHGRPCDNPLVVTPKATCFDGIQNQGEAGVDCGGPCQACSDIIEKPNGCFRKSTGVQTSCPETIPPCYDMAGNIVECPDGIIYSCRDPSTGKSIACPADEVDVTPDGCFYKKVRVHCPVKEGPKATCFDGIQNQGEEKIDCGGPCVACIAEPTCSDNIQNQWETDVDCGGPCPACASCSDGIQNADEDGVDCGGPCPRCATCEDFIQNQGEEKIDCGGPCEPCLKIIKYDDLPQKVQEEILAQKVLLMYYDTQGDEDGHNRVVASILRVYKEAVDKLGGDSSSYDIMRYLIQLEADQKQMSAEDKRIRIKNADQAYYDLLIDNYLHEKGLQGISEQAIEDKGDQIKAEYGRVLLFDQDNVKANKALADIYDKEGKEQEAKILYTRALKNADPDTYHEIKAILSTYKKEAADDLHLPEVPNDATSRFINSIKGSINSGLDKADLALYEQEMQIKIWIQSASLSKERKNIWAKMNEAIFSFSPEKITSLGDIDEE